VAGVLVTAGLAGCSHGTQSYCSTLKDDQKKLAALSRQSAKPGQAGAKAVGDTVAVLSDLRDQAPDDIADEWATLVEALQGLVDAVKATGHPLADFAGGTKRRGEAGRLRAAEHPRPAGRQEHRAARAGRLQGRPRHRSGRRAADRLTGDTPPALRPARHRG
jgi:hypothetical protein